MFSENCSQSIRVQPGRWYSKLTCFVQWLSHVLCSMFCAPCVSFCWLMLHRLLTTRGVCDLFMLQCTSPMGCRPFRDVPTPFWHENHPKSAYSSVSLYCLGKTPFDVPIRHALACSSKFSGFFHWRLNRFQH